MPKTFSFRTDLDKNYNETKLRNLSNSNLIIYPTYNKLFNWNRMYDIKYDVTRTLKLDFNVTHRANIDEPSGKTLKVRSIIQTKNGYNMVKFQEFW